jgi:hypothetical protein
MMLYSQYRRKSSRLFVRRTSSTPPHIRSTALILRKIIIPENQRFDRECGLVAEL